MSTLTLRPVGDGAESGGWYNSVNWDQVNNWSYLDEAVADDADYLNSLGGAGRALFAFADHGVETGIISSVTVYFRVWRESSGRTVKPSIRSGSTTTDGSSVTVPGSATTYNQAWNTNPTTGSAWTWEEIDSLQAGLWASNDAVNWSWLYVVVTYTEAAATALPVLMNSYRRRR